MALLTLTSSVMVLVIQGASDAVGAVGVRAVPLIVGGWLVVIVKVFELLADV